MKKAILPKTFISKPFLDVEPDILEGNVLEVKLYYIDIIDILRKVEALGSICLSLFNDKKKYYLVSEYNCYRTDVDSFCEFYYLRVKKTHLDNDTGKVEAEIVDIYNKTFLHFNFSYLILTENKFLRRFKPFKEKTSKSRFNAFKQPLYLDVVEYTDYEIDATFPDLDIKYYAGHFRNHPIISATMTTFMSLNTALRHLKEERQLCFLSGNFNINTYYDYKDRYRLFIKIIKSQDFLEINFFSKFLSKFYGTLNFKILDYDHYKNT